MKPFEGCLSSDRVIEAGYDVVVVGGGLAGVCAAIAAARHGCKTAIVQNRPVFGGNSSSEVRVQPTGANNCGAWARETGIIEELLIEERARNHDLFLNGRINSVWDLVLYEWVKREQNLTAYLNTHVVGVLMSGPHKISAVLGVQIGSERVYKLYGRYFIDCTGDGTVGAYAGAEFRFGRESRREFGESLAPEEPDRMVQGSSLLFRARDVGSPVPFVPPRWAEEYPTEDSLYMRRHACSLGPYGVREYVGYWWIEVGAPFDVIDQNEEVRDELLRHLLGVWDHIKNRGEHGAENMAIDWIGMVPGKRESRRLIGDYILTEDDVRNDRQFPDRVAYGGWFIDIHTMGGILAKGQPPEPLVGDPDLSDDLRIQPYSIPLRCLYSKNIENLLMAGRDISVTHVALGTTRVMLTCAVLGQAAGTAAAISVKKNVTPRAIVENPDLMRELQQTLVRDDCFIINLPNEDPDDIARRAVSVTATSSMALTLEPIEGSSPLEPYRSQIFPVSEGEIQTLSLFLESQADEDTSVRLEITPAKNIWSFNEPKEPLTSVEASVGPKFKGWLEVDLDLKVEPKRLYQLNVYGRAEVLWHRSKPLPGVAAAYKKPGWRRWAHEKPVYALRLNPASTPFDPDNVLSGVARPESWTNIWVSDPQCGFPQRLTLDLGECVAFNTVYLTFDTYLHEDTYRFPPLYRVPECVKDYALKVFCRDGWRTVVECRGNYHRRRVHRFETVEADKLELEVQSTNGAPTARVYEVRIYKE